MPVAPPHVCVCSSRVLRMWLLCRVIARYSNTLNVHVRLGVLFQTEYAAGSL